MATIHPTALVDGGAELDGSVRVGPYSVIGRQCHIEERAVVDHAIVWANSRISQEATVRNSILGRHCHVGRSAAVDHGTVLGDKSVLTDYSRL
jgi:NDP-sugar pyrophosphorylase family protein